MNKFPKVPNEGRITAFINGIQKYSAYFTCPTKRKNFSNNITALYKGNHVVLIFKIEGQEPIEYFNSENYIPKYDKDHDWEYKIGEELYFDADAFYLKHYKDDKKLSNLNNFIKPFYYKPSKK